MVNIKNIVQCAEQLRFPVKIKLEKELNFSAKRWDRQVTTKFLLVYDQKRVIECMVIIHYNGSQQKDLTIELSTMYGCPVGCNFCASGALTESPCFLTAIDIAKQLETCISETGINPSKFEHFYVSFTGIGEPSIIYKDISECMNIIRARYPHVMFNIATTGYDIDCFQFWRHHNSSFALFRSPILLQNTSKSKP